MLNLPLFLTWCTSISNARQTLFQQPAYGSLRRYETTERILQLIQSHDLDVWHRNVSHVDVYVPDSLDRVLGQLSPPISYSRHPLETKKSHTPHDLPFKLPLNISFHDSYHVLSDINQFINQLATNWPEATKLVNIGYSAEGREMLGIIIARRDRKKKDKPKKKYAFVIQGAQHAREWIATATALYVAHALLVPEDEPGSLHHLLNRFDFHIIPVPNPDGYEYTWTEDRLWYKNRMSLGTDAPCKGLDMNRNWGYHWSPEILHSNSDAKFNQTKVSSDKCSHWYPGSRPFEAPEVNYIVNYIHGLRKKAAFIDLRSYGQMISSPYSYSCKDLPGEAEDLLEAATGAAKAIEKVHGMHVKAGTLCQLLYSAPGNVVDYMYEKLDIKYSYAVHLRDTGTYGYLLPADNIRPTGEETAAMLSYMVKFMLEHHL